MDFFYRAPINGPKYIGFTEVIWGEIKKLHSITIGWLRRPALLGGYVIVPR